MRSFILIFITTACLIFIGSHGSVSAIEGPSLGIAALDAVTKGDIFEAKVLLNNAASIEGLDLRISFDPSLLAVVDANSTKDGIQISSGAFFNGLQAINQADNSSGSIHYVAAQGDPGVSGTGEIARISIKALQNGTATLKIDSAGLVDKDLIRLAPAVKDCSIKISELDQCFIATAAYGSKYTAPVTLLRQFRDRYLLSNSPGKTLVGFYYQTSPPLAAYISHNSFLRAMGRIVLTPVVAVVYLIMYPQWGCLVVGILMVLGFIQVMRKKRENTTKDYNTAV